MLEFMAYNTTQKIRGFLESLRFNPPLNATSAELVDLLIARVREQRRDPKTRNLFREWLAELSDSTSAAANLPAPECETGDPARLVDELAWLLDDRSTAPPRAKAGAVAPVAAAAILLISLTLNAGCQTGENPKPSQIIESVANSPTPIAETVCAEDLSVDHFNALLARGAEMPPKKMARASARFQKLNPLVQRDIISELCNMSPENIAKYIKDRLPDPDRKVRKRVDQDGDMIDARPLYKGVDF